jgi:hypothetical protein
MRDAKVLQWPRRLVSGSSLQTSVSYPGHSMSDVWWTDWHCDQYLPVIRFFPLIIPSMFRTHRHCTLLFTKRTKGEAWEPSDKATLVRISGECWTERNILNFVWQAPEGKWQVSVEVRLLSVLTVYSRVLLQKLTGSQLVKKFPAFYWTRRFITAFTSARHLSLSWASSVQSLAIQATQTQYPNAVVRFLIISVRHVSVVHLTVIR